MNNLGERSQAVGGTGCIAETAIACQMSGRATPSPLLLLYQVESTSAIPAIELEFGMTPPTYRSPSSKHAVTPHLQQVKREAESVLPEKEPEDLAWGYRGLGASLFAK
uniref:Uncharacterized protein n=1 Tax=Mus spicilegus TaxID=10103 RepID=A0A8C6GLG2_MUSSI